MRHGMIKIAARFLTVWATGISVSFSQETAPRSTPAARGEKSAVPAPGSAASPARPVDPAMMDWLLQQWEKQSARLKSLDVMILRTDETPDWGDMEFYEGRALFKAPNLAFIDFNKIKQDAKKKPIWDPAKKKWVSTPYERIVCTGTEVWQYRSDVQQIFIFPLEKNEQEKAIEEGPLPFLFNMRADDAKKRYQMTLISKDEKSYGVSIKPKLEVDKESFRQAFVKLDKVYLLPIRIVMISPDGKSKKDFQLGPMSPNKVVNDKNFEGKPLGPPWKVIRTPAGEDRPRAGMTRNRREAPVEPAAVRPAPAPGAQQR
jgi:TIGR03009 family protein